MRERKREGERGRERRGREGERERRERGERERGGERDVFGNIEWERINALSDYVDWLLRL